VQCLNQLRRRVPPEGERKNILIGNSHAFDIIFLL